jgi:hypothetical protein
MITLLALVGTAKCLKDLDLRPPVCRRYPFHY